MLEQEIQEYDVLDEVQIDLKTKLSLWNGLKDWRIITDNWKFAPLKAIDLEDMKKKVYFFMIL